MKNSPLITLIVGIFIVILIVLVTSPNVQVIIARNLDPSLFVPNLEIAESGDTGRVNRVVDGDTIVLEDGRTVRYLYVDTPETVKPGSPIECFGPEAKTFNTLFVEGKEVRLIFEEEKKDRYDRFLAIVFLEGTDTSDPQKSINAQLVLQGYARALSISPNTQFSEEFSDYENQAQEQSRGLWAECPI